MESKRSPERLTSAFGPLSPSYKLLVFTNSHQLECRDKLLDALPSRSNSYHARTTQSASHEQRDSSVYNNSHG